MNIDCRKQGNRLWRGGDQAQDVLWSPGSGNRGRRGGRETFAVTWEEEGSLYVTGSGPGRTRGWASVSGGLPERAEVGTSVHHSDLLSCCTQGGDRL